MVLRLLFVSLLLVIFAVFLGFKLERTEKKKCGIGRGFQPTTFHGSSGDVIELNESEMKRVLGSSREFFGIMKNRIPVVFRRQAMVGWTGMVTWSDEYMVETIGHLNVTIESSKNGDFGDLSSDWKFEEMSVRNFVKRYLKDNETHLYFDSLLPRELQGGIVVPRYVPCLAQREAPFYRLTNLWWGGGGERSLLHNDLQDNLVHVVAGFKEFILYPPSDGPYLYEVSFYAI